MKKSELNQEIRERLGDVINDLFAELQGKHGIDSGDIEPLLYMDLESKTDNLAECITDCILYQLKGVES